MNDFFSSIIGHDKVKQFLAQSFNKGQIAHAYLFCGPENVGKTRAAECFASILLGGLPTKLQNGYENYESEKEFQNLKNNPDFTVVERVVNEKTGKLSQNITIDQIRELGVRLQSTSFLGGRKVVVIKEGDLMNTESANAFLKNLEEPRGDTVIIILANDAGNLPATIVSRCQIVRFHSVSSEIIKKELVEQGASTEKAESIVSFSGAKPGLALQIFKNKDLFDFYQRQTADFAKILDLPLSERLAKTREMFEEKEVDKLRDKAYNILSVWEAAARRFLYQSIQETAAKPPAYFAGLLEKIELAFGQVKANVHPKLVMENLLINIKN